MKSKLMPMTEEEEYRNAGITKEEIKKWGVVKREKPTSTMPRIVFTQPIDIEIILSYDNKDQQMWNTTIRKLSVDCTEIELMRGLIESAFKSDMNYANDLCKISMCVSCKARDFEKLPCIKNFLARNGKYYFQPNQRDDIESAIIKDTVIASNTKPFNKLN